MPRTSSSDPLRLDSVSVGEGALGLTLCPGKRGDSVFGAPWERDLEADIAAIRNWGATLVVTLTEAAEMEALGVPRLGAAVKSAGMDWLHLPIPDLNTPGPDTLAAWRSSDIHRRLDAGQRVAIHCRGGLGRAGTMAALALIERGASAAEAMAVVRAARPGAIETAAQERFLSDVAEIDRVAVRVRASLFAGAMGDSLGAEIEFMDLAAIRRAFPDGLDRLPPHDGRAGSITDDTQMTLFTAEGLVCAALRGATKGIVHPPSVVHHALLRWFVTQGGRPKKEIEPFGLMRDPRLHRRRAPGTTVMAALGASPHFGAAARNDSKGCGTIMRVAPVAFVTPERVDADQVRDWAIETSALTHGHRTGQEAAAAWALILRAVLEGAAVEEAAGAQVGCFGAETDHALRAALAAPRDGRPETVETLGGGWVAEEALAIALHAVLAGQTLEERLRIAAVHSGDSDSTAAIAGNLAGLLEPEAVMAHPWRRQVECGDLIDRLARDLVAGQDSRLPTEPGAWGPPPSPHYEPV
jgi:ADP-ribosylglycohydrolase